jgi:protein-S-isoprenylcysteine O-methyltransferase Ste14
MNPVSLIRLLALLVIAGAFTISGYFRRKADQADEKQDFSTENVWQMRFRVAGALGFYGSMLLWLIYPPLMGWSAIAAWPLALRWVGLVLMALMLPFLYWMFSNLANNITPTVTTRSQHQLVTNGPYRYIRHPLYTFGTALFAGFILVAGNWFLMLTAIVALSALFSRTPQEEAMLLDRFGDEYREYMARTGRYLPRLG